MARNAADLGNRCSPAWSGPLFTTNADSALGPDRPVVFVLDRPRQNVPVSEPSIVTPSSSVRAAHQGSQFQRPRCR
ncbi:MAG: hypothetical protein M3Y91_12255, partial [Actinomycetota bacterium]|nr:hypothetical protein [Actinomycetota bacterium]